MSSPEPARKPNPSRYRLPDPRHATPGRDRPAEPAGPSSPHAEPDSHLRACLHQCQDCAGVCLRTISHCLTLGGPHAAPQHQATLHDCADICETAARFIARGSCCIGELCALCAAVCTRCAAECDAVPGEDPTMRECAQVCRLCAETCADMPASEAKARKR